MKLGIVTAYPPSKTTLNEYAFHLVKHFRLQPEVTEIILYTNVPDQDAAISFKEKGCSIRVVNCWKFNSYFNVLSITNAIRKTKPDGVLFNLQFMKFGDKKIPAAMGLFTPWFTKLLNIPSVVLLHNIMETVDLSSAGFTESPWKTKMYQKIGTTLTSIILKADRVAVTIENYVHTLESKYLVNHVVLIPHGTFEVPEEPSYEEKEGPLKIMTFGKFGTYKKVEILIEAVVAARQNTYRALEIVIAGTDNPNTPGYLATVQERYKDVPDLTFTGYVEEEDVPKIFKESDIVVFPYTSTTGSSGVLHQTGSYGKAVVMPEIGDLLELVNEEGYRGEFFEPNNTQSLAKAIGNLVIDPNYRMSLAKANYQAAKSIPMSEITQKYIDTFYQIQAVKNLKDSVACTNDFE